MASAKGYVELHGGSTRQVSMSVRLYQHDVSASCIFIVSLLL